MVELTVSQVAGIIAALVFVGKWLVKQGIPEDLYITVFYCSLVQLLLPIILGALLTGILKPENNLTTWYFRHDVIWNIKGVNVSTGLL